MGEQEEGGRWRGGKGGGEGRGEVDESEINDERRWKEKSYVADRPRARNNINQSKRHAKGALLPGTKQLRSSGSADRVCTRVTNRCVGTRKEGRIGRRSPGSEWRRKRLERKQRSEGRGRE